LNSKSTITQYKIESEMESNTSTKGKEQEEVKMIAAIVNIKDFSVL